MIVVNRPGANPTSPSPCVPIQRVPSVPSTIDVADRTVGTSGGRGWNRAPSKRTIPLNEPIQT